MFSKCTTNYKKKVNKFITFKNPLNKDSLPQFAGFLSTLRVHLNMLGLWICFRTKREYYKSGTQ